MSSRSIDTSGLISRVLSWSRVEGGLVLPGACRSARATGPLALSLCARPSVSGTDQRVVERRFEAPRCAVAGG